MKDIYSVGIKKRPAFLNRYSLIIIIVVLLLSFLAYILFFMDNKEAITLEESIKLDSQKSLRENPEIGVVVPGSVARRYSKKEIEEADTLMNIIRGYIEELENANYELAYERYLDKNKYSETEFEIFWRNTFVGDYSVKLMNYRLLDEGQKASAFISIESSHVGAEGVSDDIALLVIFQLERHDDMWFFSYTIL